MANLTRRRLIRAGLTGVSLLPALTTSGILAGTASLAPSAISLASVRLADGRFAIQAFDSAGVAAWQSVVGARCHGGCLNPDRNEAIMFERRPGWSFLVFDQHTGHLKQQIKPEKGEHFYGHGVFSPDGRWLYATTNRYETGEGVIAVYDSKRGYHRTRTLALNGVGPHELKLHPDGQTLVIALGGIRTHPDYDRMKMNTSTMEPALILLDRISGETVARFAPSHHQLSCRHLDVSPEGHIYAGYQYEGPEHHKPPLVCRYRDGCFDEINFPADIPPQLKNHLASVAVHPESGQVAVTAPKGGLALVVDGSTGELVSRVSITDCAGVKPVPGGNFLVSSGSGALFTLAPSTSSADQIMSLALAWDNHLI